MKNYYTKGAYVIYHYKVRRKVLWNNHGWADLDEWKRAIILETPRDEYGRFTNDYTWERDVTVKIMFEDGNVTTTTLDTIEPDVDPSTLSEQDVKELFKQIARGSIYYDDYRNSFGVFNHTLSDYYDGFWGKLVSEWGNEDEAEKHDTFEEFYWYCQNTEYWRPEFNAA